MVARLALTQIEIASGERLRLRQISWSQFELILTELGEKRRSRVAYYQGMLEIIIPLPEHEKPKDLIARFVDILLEELELEHESYGSTTFKRKEMSAGIEPDQCFYIKNATKMIGWQRVNLAVNPPPDLAIEVDVTSPTQINAYATLGVPEIWRYTDGQLEIWRLEAGIYQQATDSLSFPNLPIIVGINQFLEMSKTAGYSKTKKAFRQWVRNLINTSTTRFLSGVEGQCTASLIKIINYS